MEAREREAAFGQYLVANATVPEGLLHQALEVSRQTNDPLIRSLAKLGFVPESRLADAVADFVNLPRFREKFEVFDASVSPHFLKFHGLAPYRVTAGEVEVAVSNPLDSAGIRGVEFASGYNVRPVIATFTEIESALIDAFPEATPESSGGKNSETTHETLRDLASDAPTIRLVQRLITLAVDRRASDIHLEPVNDSLKVRFRLDGVLQDIEVLPSDFANPVASRIKVMAKLNIAERRLPQDGRLSITINGKEIDFRVATSPTLHGESVVLRILDRQEVELDFARLGFECDLVEQFRAALEKPHGIILLTGPTGSGKTTTLYTALKELNRPERKILTVEDPIEYTLAGINQTQIKPQIGYTFAAALRAFLRQDPDVLMVGEIRDRETAEIAIQAALTGHLLLSTLHTNSAAAAVTRLLDMGIDDFLLTSTLNLVIGQRLVRRLCKQCRSPYVAEDEVIKRYQIDRRPSFHRNLFHAGGCPNCTGGYAGRTGLVELLPLSEPIRRAVLAREDAHSIERKAVGLGMRTLFEHGLDLVLRGETTLEEVLRVTRVSEA